MSTLQSNDNRLDLASVAQEAAEYVRFLKTLGLTHLGGAASGVVRREPNLSVPATVEDARPETLPEPVPEATQEINSVPIETPRPSHEPSVEFPDSTPSEPQIEPPAPPEIPTKTSVSPSTEPKPVEPTPDMPEIPVIRMIQPAAKAAASPVSRQNSLFAFDEPPPPSAPEPPTRSDTCLKDIRDDIGDCRRCKLASGRTHIVFGDGNPHPDLVFVGEAPGADEDATGIPFVGRAGQLLNDIIKAIGMKREQVYICNVVKCRPPENRTPESDEIEACSGFLHRQLAILKPKIIVSLGAPSAFTLLGESRLGRITDIRGNVYSYNGTPLMITFHPAYLLRVPTKKREVWEDMKKVRAFLRGELRIEV